MIIPVWLMLLCSTVMGVGTSVGGEKIIKSVGMDMVKLEKFQGFSADLAGAVCLLLSSVFGIPVSTTHTKDKRDYGRWRCEETVSYQLWRCKGYDADLDLYIPGLRADQFCCCKDIYYCILGGKNSGKETGFVLF